MTRPWSSRISCFLINILTLMSGFSSIQADAVIIDLNGVVRIDWTSTSGPGRAQSIEELCGFEPTLQVLSAFSQNPSIKRRLAEVAAQTNCKFQLEVTLAADKFDVPTYEVWDSKKLKFQKPGCTYHLRYGSSWRMRGFNSRTARYQNHELVLQAEGLRAFRERHSLETASLPDTLETFLSGALAKNPECDPSPCKALKMTRLQELIKMDPELIALRTEQQRRTNYASFGKSTTAIRSYIEEVRRSRKCPVNLNAIDDMKTAATQKFVAGEHKSFKLQSFAPVQGAKPIYCGFDYTYERWIQGTRHYDPTRDVLVRTRQGMTNLESRVKDDPGILWEHDDSAGFRSYRDRERYPGMLFNGDDVYFEMEPGVFLQACGWIRSEEFSSTGFYGVELVFTPEFFENSKEATIEYEQWAPEALHDRSRKRETELQQQVEATRCD